MNPRRKRTFLWILIPVLTVVGLGFLFVQYFLDPVHYRRIIQDSLTQTLGREVSIGEARISLWEGIGVTFEDVHVKDRSGTFDLLHSKKVFLRVKLLPLLKRETPVEPNYSGGAGLPSLPESARAGLILSTDPWRVKL